MSAPPPPSGPPPAALLLHTSGPLVVGYLLTWGLFGVLAVQVYIYFLAFPRDRAVSKCLVITVFLLETLQVIIIARDMFETFARGFGNPAAITALHLSGLSAPIIAGTVGFMVQLFYAYRIKVLSKSYIVPAIICLLAVIQCVGAFISGVRGFIGKDVRVLHTLTDRIGHGIFNATCAACDIVIAISMAYYLPKLDSGIRRSTHVILTRIIWLVVGTGSLTATVAILDQIIYVVFPGKGYFLAPAFVLGKLYSNSMMVIFNSRAKIGPANESSSISSTLGKLRSTNIGHLSSGDINMDAYHPRKKMEDGSHYEPEGPIVSIERVQEAR